MKTCAAITATGRPCRVPVLAPAVVCWQHGSTPAERFAALHAQAEARENARSGRIARPRPGMKPRWTDEELRAAVTAVSQIVGRPVGQPTYDRRKLAHMPSGGTIRRRLGQWPS